MRHLNSQFSDRRIPGKHFLDWRQLAALGVWISSVLTYSAVSGQDAWPQIAVKIPPPGIKVESERLHAIRSTLETAERRLAKMDHALTVDVEVLLKSVRLALRHNEFYKSSDVGQAEQLLELATERTEQLERGKHPWTTQRGLVVRGYRSAIDNSVQPYGLHIPDELPLESNQPVPLIVWLHGRGDKTTDMHFIQQRLKSAGNVHPPFAITVHPFGRHCMGFKSAGEVDVLDVVADVKLHYPIDLDRVALMGFSMGGAGAWHLGAHYADRWVAISPGAGFAETARYTRLTVDKYPPWYEQRLWGAYDVPGYVRNLFNPTVAAYSGEVDKQIQAARVMEEAYLSQGRTLTHLIGPGMGHKYHPKTLKDLLSRMHDAIKQGRDASPDRVYLQTKTLRYGRQYWVEALRLEKHWADARADATRDGALVRLQTKNVSAVKLTPADADSIQRVDVNGASLERPAGSRGEIFLVKSAKKWRWVPDERSAGFATRAKRPGQQGPIDDAFLEPFLVVSPSGQHQHERVGRWVQFELDHLVRRWSTLYRADVIVKQDRDVTPEDIASRHLVLFGDPQSNSILRKVLAHQHRPPIQWDRQAITLDDGRTFDAATHAPVLIYPNPLNASRYIVINSGPTHREGHDRTNSLQNPKLPDWAILHLTQAPSDTAAGRVVEANFFGESWELRPQAAK